MPAVTVEMIAQLATGAPVQPAYRLDRFQTTCGSGLARDGIDAVQLKYRTACIAGKPAPTNAAQRRVINLAGSDGRNDCATGIRSTGTAGLRARQVSDHLWERACSRWHRRGATEVPHRLHRGQARSHKSSSQRQLNAGLSTLPAVTVEMIAQLASGAPVQPVYGLDRF